MATFEVTMKNRAVERVEGADAYQQEGQMTTFFRTGDRRPSLDSWSTRVASFRTAEVIIIRRFDDALAAALAIDGQERPDRARGGPGDSSVTTLPRRSA